MSGFQFFTILLVEDHMEIRTLLASILRSLGVGNVLRAANGAEAMQILRDTKKDPARAGAAGVDAIISDWVMQPVDGAMLLRWVRRHKESPNRFMPFLMLSAFSDKERVSFARDLGVNEFLSKPFAADSVASHLITAITDSRRYVKMGPYFGPDRRRREDLSDDEKRNLEKSDKEKGVRFYDPPADLRRKIGPDAGFDLQASMSAQRELDSFSEDFIDWTTDAINKLQREVELASKADEGMRRQIFDRINLIAHELRGQGGIFGYPVITTVSTSLFELTLHNLDRSNECVKLIRDHSMTLKAVVREGARGDGGMIGRELVKELSRASLRFMESGDRARLVNPEFQDMLKRNIRDAGGFDSESEAKKQENAKPEKAT